MPLPTAEEADIVTSNLEAYEARERRLGNTATANQLGVAAAFINLQQDAIKGLVGGAVPDPVDPRPQPWILPEDIQGLVYLGIPYSHEQAYTIQLRMAAFWKAAAELIDQGVVVVSPMSMEPSFPHSNRGRDWASWEVYSTSMMAACQEVWVLQLPGWDESVGVAGEIKLAGELGKTLRFLDLESRQIHTQDEPKPGGRSPGI